MFVCLGGSRLRAVSLFLENPWERTENREACERDCERDLGAAMPWLVASPLSSHAHSHACTGACTFTCFAFFPKDFQGKERLLAVYGGRGGVVSLCAPYDRPPKIFILYSSRKYHTSQQKGLKFLAHMEFSKTKKKLNKMYHTQLEFP